MCGPLLDLAPVARNPFAQNNREWAEECISFNDSVLAYVSQTPSIKTVILSSAWDQYLTDSLYLSLERVSEKQELRPVEPARTKAHLRETVERLRGLGKEVVIVAPPPPVPFDGGDCLARHLSGLLRLGPSRNCEFFESDPNPVRDKIESFLASIEEEGIANIVWLDDLLCEEGKCRLSSGKNLIYRDKKHLSYEGSLWVVKNGDLAKRISDSAR